MQTRKSKQNVSGVIQTNYTRQIIFLKVKKSHRSRLVCSIYSETESLNHHHVTLACFSG